MRSSAALLLVLALVPAPVRAQGDTARPPPAPPAAAPAAPAGTAARAAPVSRDTGQQQDGPAAASTRERTVAAYVELGVGSLLALGMIVFLGLAAYRVARGDAFRIDSHWGGFGGGLGGWRVSASLAYLATGLVFALLLAVFGLAVAGAGGGGTRPQTVSPRPAGTR